MLGKLYLPVVFALLSLQLDGVELRTWTNSDGNAFKGTLLSVKGAAVEIRRAADSRLFQIPLTALSQQDQDYVAAFMTGSKAEGAVFLGIPAGADQLKEFNVEVHLVLQQRSTPEQESVLATGKRNFKWDAERHGVSGSIAFDNVSQFKTVDGTAVVRLRLKAASLRLTLGRPASTPRGKRGVLACRAPAADQLDLEA